MLAIIMTTNKKAKTDNLFTNNIPPNHKKAMNHHDTLITRTKEALRLANASVYLGMAAIICFGAFGTLASMNQFKDSTLIYYAFHYLPYTLISLSIPISLLHALFLWRYRIMQGGILITIIGTAMGLVLFMLGGYVINGTDTAFFMSLFLAMIAWFAMPYVFRVNLRKFLNFLQDDLQNHNDQSNHQIPHKNNPTA